LAVNGGGPSAVEAESNLVKKLSVQNPLLFLYIAGWHFPRIFNAQLQTQRLVIIGQF
jgi:hypothetical protein